MSVVLSEKCFTDFIKLIHDLTGITVSSNRTSMIEGRLRKRVLALNLQSYEDYFKIVKTDNAEKIYFVDLVTTNETYFYRTPRIWDYIETKFLPTWSRENPKTVFTAWSAAASSGEEAHTLGIICQSFKEKNPNFLYQITGTDISNEMVSLCQVGKYSGRSIEAFKKNRPELFEKYLKKTESNEYQVVPEIKNRLKFYQHNLFNNLKQKEKFNLVLIRNVLIYFKGQDQEKVISLIATRMADEGVVVIGESESLTHINTGFKPIEPLIYTKSTHAPLANAS